MLSYKRFMLILCVLVKLSSCVRIFMDGCGRNGFTCNELNASRFEVVFECDNTYTGQDVELWPYDLRAIERMTVLTIQNCNKVQLVMKCTAGISSLTDLTVRNVKKLILPHEVYTQNPAKISFENITSIPNIPKHFFNQISNRPMVSNCFKPERDLSTITLRNISIGTIQSGAFYNLINIADVRLSNILIDVMETKAIDIKLLPDGKFVVKDSSVETFESQAIHIIGMRILTADNDYTEIVSEGGDTICFKTDM